MANEVKIKGKTIGDCLESLRVYSEKYGVIYKATFQPNLKEFTITPTYQSKTDPIYLSFTWSDYYREFNNLII
jgi:hypothetical protein